MDFESLREKYPNDKQKIDLDKKMYRIAEVMLDLENHEGMVMLKDELESIVKHINLRLLNEDEMSELDRKVLFAERKAWMWLLDIFKHHKMRKENIDNFYKNEV